ncbi:MAG: AAA family ATPase, partial [Candidatus Korarchaeota archaeon]|nr:AAA family ATPase [Candidatus Korarchaeota archaeon]
STLCRRLAEVLGCRHLNVGDIAKERGYILGRDEERDTLILDEDSIREEISRILGVEKCLVVETISPYAIPQENAILVVVVRCRPSVLLERLKSRGYRFLKIRENVEYEAIDGPLQDALEITGWGRIVQVDGCSGDLDREVEHILMKLEGKGVSRKFNWTNDFMSLLERLTRENHGK